MSYAKRQEEAGVAPWLLGLGSVMALVGALSLTNSTELSDVEVICAVMGIIFVITGLRFMVIEMRQKH